MPITESEAQAIKNIVNSYMEEKDAKEMFRELVSNIALVTDNDSVKQSILMLDKLYSNGSSLQKKMKFS